MTDQTTDLASQTRHTGKRKALNLTALLTLAALAGCVTAPTGPTVLVLPGSQRTFEQFRIDDTQCRAYALNLNQGKTAQQAATESGISSAVVGTVVGALAGAALGGRHGAGAGASVGLVVGGSSGAQAAHAGAQGTQRQYDNAYVQCMYAQGHRVPMPAGSQQALPASPATPASAATPASPTPALTAPPPPGSPVPPGYRPPPPNQPPPVLPKPQ